MRPIAILFDMDGTLLPQDQEVYLADYFRRLAAYMALRGFEAEEFTQAMWVGVLAMMKNDGSRTNEAAFWAGIGSVYGRKILEQRPAMDAFYLEEFPKIQSTCGCDPRADRTVRWLQSQGYRLILATNPVFPDVAQRARLQWAGVDAGAFEQITGYENSSFCKPHPGYYLQILERAGLKPEQCLMVGNDVGDDMPARELGMQVFLLTDWMINKKNADISQYPHGDFDDLQRFIQAL